MAEAAGDRGLWDRRGTGCGGEDQRILRRPGAALDLAGAEDGRGDTGRATARKGHIGVAEATQPVEWREQIQISGLDILPAVTSTPDRHCTTA